MTPADLSADPIVTLLQGEVRHERALLAELHPTLGQDLKQILAEVEVQVRDVELYFLDEKILKEPRTREQMDNWIQGGRHFLKLAVTRRERVQRLAAEYGPNARIVWQRG